MRGGRHPGPGLVVLGWLLAGCGVASLPGQVATGGDIIVGAPMSLTGDQSKEGALAREGYDLWADWTNAHGGIVVQGVRHRIQVRYLDDTSSPDVSGPVTQQLVNEDGAQFLLASYGSTSTAADAAVAERYQVPLVASSGAARSIFTQGYRYVFGVQAPADAGLRAVLDMAATRTPRPARVAVLSAADGYAVEVARSAAAYASQVGMQVVFTSQYPDGATDLSAILMAAKAARPDVVLNSGNLIEAIAITKAARDVRLDAALFADSAGPSIPDFSRALDRDAEYVYTGAQWSADLAYRADYGPTAAQFAGAYDVKYGSGGAPPDIVAGATAAGLALQRAVEQAGSLEPDRVRDALAAVDVTTFFGHLRFDAQGQSMSSPILVEQIQQGRPVAVWPPSVAGARPAFPTPAWASRTTIPAPPPPRSPAAGHPLP